MIAMGFMARVLRFMGLLCAVSLRWFWSEC